MYDTYGPDHCETAETHLSDEDIDSFTWHRWEVASKIIADYLQVKAQEEKEKKKKYDREQKKQGRRDSDDRDKDGPGDKTSDHPTMPNVRRGGSSGSGQRPADGSSNN